eukprot:31179_1
MASKGHENCTKIIEQLKQENKQLKAKIEELSKTPNKPYLFIKDNDIDDILNEIDKATDNDEKKIDVESVEFWNKMNRKLALNDIEYFKELFNSNILSMTNKNPEYGQTLLHLACENGNLGVVMMCLNLGADIDDIDRLGRKPEDCAREGGWHQIERLLIFERLGGNLGSQVKDITSNITQQNGITNYIFDHLKSIKINNENVNFNYTLKIMSKLICEIIRQKHAFSDDLLHIAWTYELNEMKQNGKTFRDTNIWKTISETCLSVIQNSNQKDWFWLKQYMLTSNIWYTDIKQKPETKQQEDDVTDDKQDINYEEYAGHGLQMIMTDEEKSEYAEFNKLLDKQVLKSFNGDYQKEKKYRTEIWKKVYQNEQKKKVKYLFYELLDIVCVESTNQSNWLKTPMNDIEKHNPSEWGELMTFNMKSTYKLNCRQDIIPNGIKPQYTHDELTKKARPSSNFNVHHHYDVYEYLSKLVLTAHMVDDDFHNSIMNIFDINKKTRRCNNDEGIMYQRGPIKLLERCKAKTETDYRFEKWPTAAHVLDINRCALVFNDIKTLLKSLKHFEQIVRGGNGGVIVDICRDKNGFLEYDNASPSYADIKLNVLIKGQYNCLIGEIQFLMYKMLQFKKRAHKLYGITRKEEFIEAIAMVLPIMLDHKKTLFVAGNEGDVKGLANLMVTHKFNEMDLLERDTENNESIMINICELNHVKALRFLSSMLNKELFVSTFLQANVFNFNCFHGILVNNDIDMNFIYRNKLLMDTLMKNTELLWKIFDTAFSISFEMVNVLKKKLGMNDAKLKELVLHCEGDFDSYKGFYPDSKNSIDFDGTTWLTTAIRCFNTTQTNELIDLNNSINYMFSLIDNKNKLNEFILKRHENGNHCIFECIMQNRMDIILLILGTLSDDNKIKLVKLRDWNNGTILHDIIHRHDKFDKSKQLFQMFLSLFENKTAKEKQELIKMHDAEFQNLFYQAVFDQTIEFMDILYEFCPSFFKEYDNISSFNDNLESVFLCCADTGFMKGIKWIINVCKKNNINVDKVILQGDNDDVLPFQYAISHAYIDICQLMLDEISTKEKKLKMIQHQDMDEETAEDYVYNVDNDKRGSVLKQLKKWEKEMA